MRTTSNNTGLWLIAALLLVAQGCSGEVFSTVDDYRSVVTTRIGNEYYKFKNIYTYQLCDTVLDLTENGETPITLAHTQSRDDAVLNAIRNQMRARGFVDVDDVTDTDATEIAAPDVIIVAQYVAQPEWDYEGIVQLSALDRQTIYYPGTEVDMTYDVESLIITMFSENVTTENNPDLHYALWTAGVHSTYTDLTADTLRAGIAAAFAQSPYITATSTGAPIGDLE